MIIDLHPFIFQRISQQIIGLFDRHEVKTFALQLGDQQAAQFRVCGAGIGSEGEANLVRARRRERGIVPGVDRGLG